MKKNVGLGTSNVQMEASIVRREKSDMKRVNFNVKRLLLRPRLHLWLDLDPPLPCAHASYVYGRLAVNPGLSVVPEGLAFAERLAWVSLAGSAWCARSTEKRRR